MKIAVVTKKNIADKTIKNNVLNALRLDKIFDVVELKSATELTPDFDKILVFGGDGTIIEAVDSAIGLNIPVVGINLGNLGFLSRFEADSDIKDIISSLKSDKTEARMLLTTELNGVEHFALNDVVVKSNTTRPAVLKLYVDGKFVDTYHSDGLIVSTPTGSTAYSLSAGGPVLAPDVEAVVINPVCSHSLHSRPLVINAKSCVEIKFDDNKQVDVVVDGNKVEISNENRNENLGGSEIDMSRVKQNGISNEASSVKITKSTKCALFGYVDDSNFYKKLLDKMNRWGTTQI
ncbi:MAG: NAD(+)/NADH kinase [Clostridia bacterium]